MVFTLNHHPDRMDGPCILLLPTALLDPQNKVASLSLDKGKRRRNFSQAEKFALCRPACTHGGCLVPSFLLLHSAAGHGASVPNLGPSVRVGNESHRSQVQESKHRKTLSVAEDIMNRGLRKHL